MFKIESIIAPAVMVVMVGSGLAIIHITVLGVKALFRRN